MIEVRDLHKAFGKVKAVDGVSFTARDGEITGLLGPNGAGKTTTLRMLYTLMTPDRGQVLVRARSAGVTRLLVPATAAAGWPKLRQVCADAPGLYPAYGLHPVFLAEHRPQHLDALGQWIERERPLAIGECGLDHFVDGLDRQAQAFYFEGQLRLAGDTGLPLVVHARRAVDATIAAIRRIGSSRPHSETPHTTVRR